LSAVLSVPAPSAGFLARALRHPSFAIGAALSLLLLAAAALSLVWSPYPPAEIDIPHKLQAASAAHWFGTDSLGRDIASQLLVGARASILVGVFAVLIGFSVGTALGLLGSARGGWVEEAVMRMSDFTFAFPALLSAILLGAIYGPGCSPASSRSASSTSRCSRVARRCQRHLGARIRAGSTRRGQEPLAHHLGPRGPQHRQR
jgi:peptide/nickel transport system permease protein